MRIHGVEIEDLESLCKMLAANNIEKVYLSHYPGRERATQQFAARLRNKGFLPMVAADYRKHGEEAVSKAIGESQFLIVCAFTDAEMKECKSKGLSFISLR